MAVARLARRNLLEARTDEAAVAQTGVGAYIQEIRFNQAPHPVWFRPRLEHGSAIREPANKFIAYYLPQYHPNHVNDAAWGIGFTEWTNSSKALPQYHGHYQPHFPADLGYYDLRIPQVLRQQVDMARQYGVYGFCFHYYWFDGLKVMDLPLRNFLADPSLDLRFCICWANENWTRKWDGLESEVILQQHYSFEKCLQFMDDVLDIVKDDRYIRVDGKPMLVVYRPSLIPQVDQVTQSWRRKAVQAGLPGLWLVSAQTFGVLDPRPMGFDAAVEFPPHKINDRLQPCEPAGGLWNPGFDGKVWSYSAAAGEAITREKEPYPMYRSAFPSWDNEARRPGCGYSFEGANPAEFDEWLATCLSYARETLPASEGFVFVNAWNEWAEGAHLEPDRHFGYAWLECVLHQARRHAPDCVTLDYGVEVPPGSQAKLPVAVVVHLYHVETWLEIEQALQQSGLEFDLLVTTTAAKMTEVTALVRSKFLRAEIFAVENRGRDMRPFFSLMPLLLARNYQAVLKLHSKKSTHRGDGDVWRQALIAKLLPGSESLQRMLASLAAYPSLGMVAPQGNVLNLQRYIGSNQQWVQTLTRELGETGAWLDAKRPWFAAGSMFWFKPAALTPLLCCASVRQDRFETESGQVDGTLAHALERMMGAASLVHGYHLVDSTLACSLSAHNHAEKRSAQQSWQREWSCQGRTRVVDSPFARPTEMLKS